MLHLFGPPELALITAEYFAAAQLGSDWQNLISLHQLLVHAASHGPSYGAAAEQTAARYA